LDVDNEAIYRLKNDYEHRMREIMELKNRIEWRLGEVTQNYHDTKWRLGEVEATMAHKDLQRETVEKQLHEAQNRIKELESITVSDSSPSSTANHEEIQRLKEENGKIEWRLGEVNQRWNDAKWRVGELEAETEHRSHLLDEAHHRIGSLERQLEGTGVKSDGHLRKEIELLQSRVVDLDRLWNDAKWRIGELEAELTHKRDSESNLRHMMDELNEQNGKVKWHLGEVSQWWKDTKFRLGEVQSALDLRERQLQEATSKMKKMVDVEKTKEKKPLPLGSSDRNLATFLNKDGTFLINKQPNSGRNRWNLLTYENTFGRDPNISFRRTRFEFNANGATEIYLIGSFVNWECALLCRSESNLSGRHVVWVELPPGRHEFRFLVNGRWTTADNYSQLTNEFGDRNNFIDV